MMKAITLKRLKNIREELGVSQQEFGPLLGMSRSSYNKLETGTLAITLRTAASLVLIDVLYRTDSKKIHELVEKYRG